MAAGKAITWPVPYSGSTPTVYCHIIDGAGSIYRFGSTNAFETYTTANIAEYKLAATELGTDSRMFQVALPTDATDIPAGGYYVVGRTQAGGSPAEADAINYEGWFAFDGTNWSYIGGPVASVTGAVGSVGSGGITAASIATGAIDADAIAADAVTEIQAGLSTLDAAGVRAAVGLAAANLDTQLTTIDDFLDTEVAAIKAKTDNLPASPAAVGSAMTLASGAITAAVVATGAIDADAIATDAAQEIADAILDRTDGVETSLTLRQALRLVVAAASAKLSGAATTTIVIRNYGDTKDRITATVDANGNRTAITYDLT